MPDAEQDLNAQDGRVDERAAGDDWDGAMLKNGQLEAQKLPPGRVRNALIIGVLAGVLSIAQSIAISLVNAPTYHAFDVAQDQAARNALAFSIFGYAVLTFVITMIICLAAGFIAGKVCVQRRAAFLAGFVVGIINYATGFITHYIPHYPGSQQAGAAGINNAATAFGGIAVFLAFLLVWGILTGLMSLLGAWLATRRHALYMGA
jgi:hypothetical protein